MWENLAPSPDLAQLGNPWVLGTTPASTPSLNCQLRKWKEHLWEKQQNGGWAGRARSLACMAEGLSGFQLCSPRVREEEEEALLGRQVLAAPS